MKAKFSFLLRYFAFWYGFFVLLKLIFLVFFIKTSFRFMGDWPAVFYHGLRLDLSTIAYIFVLPCIVLSLSSVIKGKWSQYIINYFSFLLLVVFCFLAIADLAIYREWGFRLDATPLIYLSNIKDALASTPLLQILIMIVVVISFSYLCIKLFNKLVKQELIRTTKVYGLGAPVFLLLTGLLIIPIRGGFATAPVNNGTAYFHKEALLNHAALNLPWNIMYSLTKLNDMKNPFIFYADLPSADFIKEYGSSGNTTKYYVKSSKPSIIVIVLESFTSKVIGCLNGIVSATPHLDSIASHGLLFKNFYASGARSDKGLVAILSGYPALPNSSIMIFPNKTQLIPGLAKSLTTQGYNSAYYYGGDINFASMKSYMLNCGFQKIVSQDDFKTEEKVMSWGAADEYLFNKVYSEIEKADTPYFKVLFTLSSHPPYDIPAKPWKRGTDRETMFINSIHYSDSCLGDFVDKLNNSDNLENTLLIIVADHGNTLPGNSVLSAKEKYQIPMVWYGGALTESGEINQIANQTDIPKTLLEQLHVNSDSYIFSRNIIGDKYTSEALFAFSNGFGFVNDSMDYTYTQSDKRLVVNSGKSNSNAEERGKKFYQALHDNFLNLK